MEVKPSSPAGLPGTAALAFTGKRLALLIAFGVLTIALLLALGGGRTALAALRHVDPRLIALALVVHYSGFAVRGLRWQQLLRVMHHPLPWRFVTTLLLAGWFVSALLPARAGDVMRVGVLRLSGTTRAPVPVADAVGSIVLERALDLLAILVLGAGFGLLVLRTQLPGWVLAAYGVGIGGLLGFGIALLLTPRLLTWLRQRSSHRIWHALLDFAAQLVVSLRTLLRQPGRASWLVVQSLYIWLCDALLLWLCVGSLGVWLPWGQAAFIALTVDVFAVVPLTPGGVGQIETINAALLALLHVPGFNVAAAVLVNRAISYWSFLLFTGLVTFAAGFGQWLLPQATIPPQPSPQPSPQIGQ